MTDIVAYWGVRGSDLFRSRLTFLTRIRLLRVLRQLDTVAVLGESYSKKLGSYLDKIGAKNYERNNFFVENGSRQKNFISFIDSGEFGSTYIVISDRDVERHNGICLKLIFNEKRLTYKIDKRSYKSILRYLKNIQGVRARPTQRVKSLIVEEDR